MKYFLAAHDFHAEEEVELAVRKGEVLCASEGVAQDGWMKVEVISDARRRGFVPLSYLTELTAAEAMALLEATNAHEPQGGHSAAATPSRGAAQLSTPQRSTANPAAGGGAQAHQLTNNHNNATPTSTTFNTSGRASPAGAGVVAVAQQSPSPRVLARSPEHAASAAHGRAASTPLTPAQQAAGPVSRHLLENPNAAVDAFMKNEVYFRQLMQRRSTALAQMQAGIEEARAEVAASKDCNAVLTRKLRELDEVVERERSRWMSRVEEEKAHVSRTVPYSAAMAVPVSHGTTPVRSPISGRRGGPGRSVVEDETPRQLRA